MSKKVTLISQYMRVSNHHIVHLNLKQCYVNYISIKLGGGESKLPYVSDMLHTSVVPIAIAVSPHQLTGQTSGAS